MTFMQAMAKREADAYDKMLDVASELSDLIEKSGLEMDEYTLEELTIFLAKNGQLLKAILGHLKMSWP